ncbi:MAG: hypothetical protein K9N06_08355 [Candidatus Cloacimonetes bacterium]|nr:hypothetical protein [Candidatus Cloacimonadota bacterium]
MKKQILIIMALITFSLLPAQNTEQELNLEDILIIGKSEAVSDTIKPAVDNPIYNTNKKIEELRFTPYFREYQVRKMEKEKKDNSALIQMLAGGRSIFLGRLLYCHPQKNWLNFSGKYFSSEFSDYNEQSYIEGDGYSDKKKEMEFTFAPEFREKNVYLRFQSLNYQNYWVENSVTGINLQIPQFRIESKPYFPANLALDISWNYYHSKLDDQDIDRENYDEKRNSYNIITDIDWDSGKLQPQVRLGNVNEKAFGEIDLTVSKSFSRFDKLGLWFAADNRRALPALTYAKSFDLGNSYSLSLRNTPEIVSSPRIDLLSDYNYLSDEHGIELEKTPFNHYLILQRNSDFGFFWNCRYTYDYLSYENVSIFSWRQDYITEPHQEDIWKNSIGQTASYSWKKLLISEKTTFHFYSEELLFQPLMESELKAEFIERNYRGELEVIHSSGCRIDDDNYMKDIVVMNVYFRYLIGRHFTLLLEVENVLDKDLRGYAKSVSQADAGITLLGGISFSF